MLILSRKKNESIINDDIVVMVVEVRSDKVRLGFQAPKEVAVHRREIYEAIKNSERPNEGRQKNPGSSE